MFTNPLKKIFGSRNDRLLRKYAHAVQAINALEPGLREMSDADLRARTDVFKQRVQNGEALDDLLVEAFATVREASRRVLNMRHFDVQLLGGHRASQRQDRGNAHRRRQDAGRHPAGLSQRARRDAVFTSSRSTTTWPIAMPSGWGACTGSSGLSVGVNLSQMEHELKQQAYAADITYGTNSEFGFDYLRDNMVFQASERVQRGLTYAIVDEVDSILIDEARTPLIISGQADDSTDLYYRMNDIVPKLTRVKEENGPATSLWTRKRTRCCLTEAGHERAEDLLTRAGPAAGERQPVRRRQHRRSCTMYTPLCGRTRCSIATSTTWRRTTRSSSSTNSPDA